MNIAIKVGNKVGRIRSDQRNYMFGYECAFVNKKTGETEFRYNPELFYSSLSGLFDGILTLKVRSSTATTLGELQEDIAEAKRMIKEVWNDTMTEEELNDG